MKNRILIFILICASTIGHAANDGGGGNSVGSELFDFVEDRGREPIDIRSLPAYTRIQPLIEKIGRAAPDLKDAMLSSLNVKKWYFESNPLNNTCRNQSAVELNQEVVACQFRDTVLISKDWYENTAKPSSQEGILIHEMLIHMTTKLKQRSQLSVAELEWGARELNRFLFRNLNFTREELQEKLVEVGFGYYSHAHAQAISEKVSRVYQLLDFPFLISTPEKCEWPKELQTNENVKIYREAMDEVNSILRRILIQEPVSPSSARASKQLLVAQIILDDFRRRGFVHNKKSPEDNTICNLAE